MIEEYFVPEVSASLYSSALRQVPPFAVERTDFAPHFPLTKLLVENFGPLSVGIDARGVSRCQAIEKGARERRPAIMAQRASRRAAAQADTRQD